MNTFIKYGFVVGECERAVLGLFHFAQFMQCLDQSVQTVHQHPYGLHLNNVEEIQSIENE